MSSHVKVIGRDEGHFFESSRLLCKVMCYSVASREIASLMSSFPT